MGDLPELFVNGGTDEDGNSVDGIAPQGRPTPTPLPTGSERVTALLNPPQTPPPRSQQRSNPFGRSKPRAR